MKFLLGLAVLFIIPGAAVSTWIGVLWLFSAPGILHFGLGFGAGLLGYYLLLSKIDGFSTFEHELTHAIVALLFFRRINDFTVTRYHGGMVSHTSGFGGEFGNHLIGLAPYYLPTFSLIVAFIRPLIPAPNLWIADLGIGFTLAYHFLSTASETRQAWTKEGFTSVNGEWTRSDVGRRGFIFSSITILSLGLALHGVIFWLMRYGYRGISGWGRIIYSTGLTFYRPLLDHAFAYIQSFSRWLQHLL